MHDLGAKNIELPIDLKIEENLFARTKTGNFSTHAKKGNNAFVSCCSSSHFSFTKDRVHQPFEGSTLIDIVVDHEGL